MSHPWICCFALIGLLLPVRTVAAEMGPAVGPDKKLIKVGQDAPDTAYLRKHIAEMERWAFDGVVIVPKIRSERGEASAEWLWFSKKPVQESHVAHMIENLKATEFNRFTDNFIWVASCVYRLKWSDGTLDPVPTPGWFDEDFQITVDNMAMAARVAKEGGLKGIFLDLEQYGGGEWDEWMQPFNFPYAALNATVMPHTFETCQTQVHLRGRQIMEAICREYPGITVIIIPGTHALGVERIGKGTAVNPHLTREDGLASSDYALLPAFVDGLLNGASPEATIIDGWEHSYPYTLAKRFKHAREVFDAAAPTSADPELYRRKLKLGLGLMLDWRRWSTSAPYYNNHFTPKEFEFALYNALRHTDQYVWIWAEQAVVFPNAGRRNTESTVPEAYRAAIEQCRNPHPLIDYRDPRGAAQDAPPPHAKSLSGYGERETFAPLRDNYRYIMDLPTRWLFIADAEDIGAGYFQAVDWDTSEWKPIKLGDYYENLGYPFNGTAWYRCEFEAPEELTDRRSFLHFGGIAGSAVHLYLNGQWLQAQQSDDAGTRSGLPNGVWGWEITEQVKPGRKNVVTIYIIDHRGPAGIYKPYVKLGVSKKN